MAVKEACLDHTLSEVEELTGAVRLLKSELADQPAALEELQGQQAGLLVLLGLHGPVRRRARLEFRRQ